MLTKIQAERIAGAIQLMQPNWTIPQLMGVMGDPRIRNRPMADVAACLGFLACDGETKQPTRAFEPGIWWATATTREATSGPTYRYPNPRDCGTCAKPETGCRCGNYTPAFVQHADKASPEQIAAAKKAAIENAKPLPVINQEEAS